MSVPDVASAGALLVIDRSAARTSVFAVAALLAVLGSKVTELTVAVLVSVLPSGVLALTCATIVKLTVAPLAVGPVVQFTVPAEPTAGVVQVQPAGVMIDWNVVPGGSGSVTVTLAAVEGPLLLTTSVYVRFSPGRAGSGASVLVIERSAEAMTVVDAVAVLLDESGSEVEELTEAVLPMVPPSLGAVTRIVMGGAAPGGRVLARVQVTPVLVPLQVQPAPLAPWKVTPGGSESVTLIGAAAVLGPALLTVSV